MSIHITSSATVESQTGSLKLARIGYDNQSRSGVVSASSEEADFPAIAAQTDNTYESWKPTAAPAWWKADLGSAKTINYCGIAAHELGNSTSVRLKVQYSTNDIAWNDASDQAFPLDNSTILFLFPVQTARYWRVYIEGAVEAIGHIRFGSVLVMQRGIYRGYTPLGLARETDIRPNISEGGQFLGRSVIKRGFNNRPSWQHLTATWYRANFDPFVKDAREHPFFFAWRAYEFLADVAYVWADGDIIPTNSGPANMMTVTVNLSGNSSADA